MEVLENSKDSIKLGFDPYDQGILNLIKEHLWKDKATQLAGFRVTHPQVGKAEFVLKTKDKDAKAVWNVAIKSAAQEVDLFAKGIKNV